MAKLFTYGCSYTYGHGLEDCIIGKVQISPKGEKNNSRYAGMDEQGYVDRIIITNEKDTQKPMFKIKLKEYRKYIAGDKVALRYAQKGTLGRIASREEMIRVSSKVKALTGKIDTILLFLGN